MLITETDILICGAGPAGLMMACQFTHFSVRFRILDMQVRKPSYSGALILHSGSMEIFSQLGLHQGLLTQGVLIDNLNFIFKGKQRITIPIDKIGQDLSSMHRSVIIEQANVEQAMEGFLKERDYHIERPAILNSFIQHEGYVECLVTNARQLKEKIFAKYLIAADGFQSFVRQFSGLSFNGKSHVKPLFIMDCQSDSPPFSGLHFSFSKESSVGVFPLTNGRIRIDGTLHSEKPLESSMVKNHLNNHTWLDLKIKTIDWYSEFRSNMRIASSFNSGRCFLIGDAAHVFSPVGAQGMNQGFYDAKNLAWKIAFVTRGFAKPELLATYESERKKIVRRIGKITNLLFKGLSSQHYLLMYLRLVLLPVMLHVLKYLLRIRFVGHYIFEGYSGIGHTPQRLRDILYYQNGTMRNLFSDLNTGSYTLLIFNKKNTKTSGILLYLGPYRAYISVVIYKDSLDNQRLFKKMKIGNRKYMLIRPDFIIACSGKNPTSLRNYLKDTFQAT